MAPPGGMEWADFRWVTGSERLGAPRAWMASDSTPACPRGQQSVVTARALQWTRLRFKLSFCY